ncbi:hypothetical protein SISNIDRAFT_454956 [Sistotremastrum niveocremeum HHB9708]|uniref:Presequence protease, mitochondrial n=2 Tax=Sistotremastraceae TaxID=3402574 RepID=A0A164U8A5_9AGAM|nr:hypothetical protein SISNIDRAFT_454956 [Sistotremastrum niveocremeum HHB9708]KZT44320.1 hypothetical protein SISSUDRAFT_1038822 [Sistotremastrum suecicum HHB10207 ss-3]
MAPGIDVPPKANGVTTKQTVAKLGNFDLVKSIKVDYTDLTVSKWISSKTGLTLIHLDYEAPIVKGYFVVRTEIFDDTGRPHTLEHLVFMGSKKYPYKGILDHFANRGFSNGTNAWTDIDHTAYTVATAGSQGFLQILPVYLDHILNPTLLKSGFVTEVHHIDGAGEDSGVVYSEMQGRENTSGDLMALRMQRLLNPDGSGYRSEIGGLMEVLREITVEDIRTYHSQYYVPHNLAIVVAGKIDPAAILETLETHVEPGLIENGFDKGPNPPGWKRPFVETESANRPGIPKTIQSIVEFPEKDESTGEIAFSFVGPSPTNYLEDSALDLLGTYLTSSATAPLNKEFIETANPLCTYIYFDANTRVKYSDLQIIVGSVPVQHLEVFDQKLISALTRIANEGINMDRMSRVISRDRRKFFSALESAQGDAFSTNIISDYLYGDANGKTLQPLLDDLAYYDALSHWTSDQWVELLRRYFLDSPRVVILGKPSAGLADRLQETEKARIQRQIQDLGPAGLENARKELEKAKTEHDAPIPQDILSQFKVPDVRSISWIPVKSYQNAVPSERSAPRVISRSDELAKHIEADGNDLPFFVQFDHVKSDFIKIHAFLSLRSLPDHLRPYLTIYQGSFFSLPVKRASGVLSHTEVVDQLENETVGYSIGLGQDGSFEEALKISMEVETTRYSEAISWLRDLLFNSQFDEERLRVTVAKVQQSLPELKRDGSAVASSFSGDLLYNRNSTSQANTLLQQIETIPKLARELEEDPARVIQSFTELRNWITKPAGLRFSVSGNVLAVKEPRSSWAKYFTVERTPLEPIRLACETLSDLGKAPSQKAVVVSLPTIESSFSVHTAKSIQGWGHPEWPALRIAVECLNALESFLWRYIRGSGLAYGAYIGADLESGLVSFTLYRSPNAYKAFEEGAKVVRGLADGSIPLDQTVVDAAKSSIVYGVTKAVSTPGRAAMNSFANQALKGVSHDFNVQLLDKYQEVTIDDVRTAIKRRFLPLFDPSSSIAVVVSAPGKVEEISSSLTEAGFTVDNRVLEVAEDEAMEVDDGSSSDDSSGSSER